MRDLCKKAVCSARAPFVSAEKEEWRFKRWKPREDQNGIKYIDIRVGEYNG